MNILIIRYIVNFLVGKDCLNSKDGIAYTNNDIQKVESPVIIRPSNFFDKEVYGTKETLPELPLKSINGMPFLYGEPIVEYKDGKIIIYADLIASAYFLISRYEEILRPGIRDIHGRFPGKESLPYRAGFIDRPIIDEYGKYLRCALRKTRVMLDEVKPSFGAIYLTHDIDHPWEYFNLKGAIRGIFGILKRERRIDIYPLLNYFGIVEKDPNYTFSEIIKLDLRVRQKYNDKCKVIYFVKSGGNFKLADGNLYVHTNACKKLLEKLKSTGAILGYHSSYEAGIYPDLMINELKKLELVVGEKIRYNRNHYLNSREPRDFRKLIEIGITDDFTMGYADVAGFRLGTSRCVHWIDPKRMELTNLRLHPLIIMDRSLTADTYMGLSEEEALKYAYKLINQIYKHNGDLSLLWHNTSLINNHDNKNRKLYENIIEYLCGIIEK